MTTTIPAAALAAARRDPCITQIKVYDLGWLPTSYRWPATARCRVYSRGTGKPRRWTQGEAVYDRKRPYAKGPQWVAVSVVGGVLARG